MVARYGRSRLSRFLGMPLRAASAHPASTKRPTRDSGHAEARAAAVYQTLVVSSWGWQPKSASAAPASTACAANL